MSKARIDADVTLRVMGHSLDFAGLEAGFGTAPTYVHRQGDKRRESAEPSREDTWQFKVEGAYSLSIDEVLAKFCDAIVCTPDFVASIRESGSRVDLIVWFRTEFDEFGFSVSNETLQRVCSLGLELGFSALVG